MSESKPIEIFCCVAESDQPFLEKLSTRLTVQQKRGTITLWDKSQIEGGKPVNREIRRHLASARIFLLLIGPDFLGDDYCYNQVMKNALKRHMSGDARIIPVIVRYANWQDVDILDGIQVLPKDGRPISGQSDEDKALWEIAEEIGVVIKGLDGSPVEPGTVPGGRDLGNAGGESDTKPKGGGTLSPIGDSGGSPPLMPQPNPGPVWLHFLKLTITRSWGWAIIGVLVLLTGMLWGLSSPTVPYIKAEDVSTVYSYAHQGSDIYIYPTNSMTTSFIAQCNNLSPHIDCTNIHGYIHVLFLARPDTISVNATLLSDTTGRSQHVTQAHVIEQLILYDASGTSSTTYQASDYNPGGYYENRWWPVAIVLIVAGLLIVYVAFFVWRRRRRGA